VKRCKGVPLPGIWEEVEDGLGAGWSTIQGSAKGAYRDNYVFWQAGSSQLDAYCCGSLSHSCRNVVMSSIA
jgi:hypothetical protein